MYWPMFKKFFAEYNLPVELIFLCMIESGVIPFAVSRAKAAGVWQFVKGTGRLYSAKIFLNIGQYFASVTVPCLKFGLCRFSRCFIRLMV